MPLLLKQSLKNLNKVGEVLEKRLNKLDLKNILDLIFYFPNRYEDFSKISLIKDLKENEQITIQGKIEIIRNKKSWKKRMTITEAVVTDKTDSIKIIWFNQPFISKTLKAGDKIYLSGKVVTDNFGFYFQNPIYEKIKKQTAHTARIIPIYALTQGITQKQLRFLTKQALAGVEQIKDWLPEKIIKKYKLIKLASALKQIHFPDNWQNLKEARKRLAFNELFILALYNLKNKEERKNEKSINIKFNEKQIKNLVDSLSFELTSSQKKCAWQIIKDLEKKQPMNRLLEGDVGSGKTIVAAIAMYNTALSGYQSVLMAPTEILANQHVENLEKILGKNSVSIITRTRKKILEDSKIFVGTHALIQKKITFKNLGLAIIDEQHRFGVKQRKALQEKSGNKKIIPHLLSMTATPIPRSLALTIYGDLNLSVIDEMPEGRKKIITRLVEEKKRHKAYEFIKEKIKQDQQVFVVCPLISESDKLGVKSVEAEYEKLKNDIFPDLKIAKLHGKLKSKDKEKIMLEFKNKKYNVLVSTSVIEVGIDIPNATTIMIEGADRFGLAQLHQFRGRVGRSQKQSYCLLFTDSKNKKTLDRLEALVKSNDGFALAEYDLKLRGPGNVYSTDQSGFLQLFKIANLADHVLINETKQAAEEIINELENYVLLKKRLENFSEKIHLE